MTLSPDVTSEECSKLLTTEHITPHQSVLLRRLQAWWGKHGSRAVGVPYKMYTNSFRHELAVCNRTRPTPQRTHTEQEVMTLLRLHQKFGPSVVHMDRLIDYVTLPLSIEMPHGVTEQIMFSQCAPRFMCTLLSVHTLLRVNTKQQATYPPPVLQPHTEGELALVSPHQFVSRFHAATHGVLRNFNWEGVVMAGGCAAACASTQLHADTAGDVDLFVSPRAVSRVINHFAGPHTLFGLTQTVVTVCMKGVSRVFQIIPVDTPGACVHEFDLDYCQLFYSGNYNIKLTMACMRAMSSRVSRVDAGVMPKRQAKTRRKGLGLDVRGLDVLPDVTMWEHAHGYKPTQDHALDQIRNCMILDLKCRVVTEDAAEVEQLLSNTDTRNTPSYIPNSGVGNPIVARAFGKCRPTRDLLFSVLPPLLSGYGVRGVALPYTLVFPRLRWSYVRAHGGVDILPNHDHILDVLNTMQQGVDEVYGHNVCPHSYLTKRYMTVTLLPTSRVVHVYERRVQDSVNDTVLELEGDASVVMDLCCSHILMINSMWYPVFVSLYVDVFSDVLL